MLGSISFRAFFRFAGFDAEKGHGAPCPFFVWERIGQEQNDFTTVAPKRLLQLSAAGEVFLEGTCPLSRCPQTAKLPAPLLLGARRRWVRKATAFRGRSEQDRSALVCRLLCCDFGNIPVECFQRVIPFSGLTDTAQPVPTNVCQEHLASWISWISLTDSTIPFLFIFPRTFCNLPLFSLAIYAFHIILKANSAFLFVHSYKLLPNLLTN